jgi:hypothetical protein
MDIRSFRASTKSRRFWRIKKLCAFCVGFSGAPPFLKGGSCFCLLRSAAFQAALVCPRGSAVSGFCGCPIFRVLRERWVLVAQVVPLSFGGRPEVFPAEFVAQGARARRESARIWKKVRGALGFFAVCLAFSGAPPFLKGGFLAEAPLGGRQNVAQGGTGVPSMRLSSARNSRGKKSRTGWGGATLGTFGEFNCLCSRLFAVN